MKRPDGYDDAKVQGEFTPVELGGHKMIIKQVSERQNKNGGDMIVVLFDFAQDDAQAGYFMKQFQDDIRPEKKWPNQATKYINVNDNEGKCSSAFKTFCTCVEHSNAGFESFKKNGDFDITGFKNKKVGGVFGEEMDYYNGEEKKKRVLRWFLSMDKVADAQIPNLSETKAYKEWAAGGGQSTSSSTDGFMNIPDGIDEELPFN